ncbi:MAG: DctP family TRAP transporter solute-binding subunit [Methylobacteriaceae bacterium]|jgi:C4-dicarboxylate transporter DctM subunit|nr:DctP family TRAP transporter solute-binding subunit [Methylobacteriaceae bacterium]
MNKIISSLLGLGVGIMLTSAPVQAQTYDDVTLRFSLNGTDVSVEARVINKFTELVKEASGGKIKIQSFPNAQLAGGNLAKSVEIATMGTVDLACWSQSVVASLDNGLFAVLLPWVFSDYAQAEEVYNSTAGDYITKALGKHGLTYITFAHNGIKAMTNSKRLIKKPDDLKNMKIRVSGGALNMDFYSAFGADPIAMSWSEVYTALQQGTVDGHDNSLVTIKSANIQEVQKYMTISKHMYDAFLFAASTDRFAKLNKDSQELIKAKLSEAAAIVRKEFVEEESGVRKEFEAQGVEFYEFTPEDTATFKAVAQPVIDKYKVQYGEEACKAFGIK